MAGLYELKVSEIRRPWWPSKGTLWPIHLPGETLSGLHEYYVRNMLGGHRDAAACVALSPREPPPIKRGGFLGKGAGSVGQSGMLDTLYFNVLPRQFWAPHSARSHDGSSSTRAYFRH
ncbi:hypothetical protein ANN_04802 [Periplaneta americana]|uniref:Uncharacterized protein n=1 Tax=Periplaneta americana TaxID=6978 RepID=A0ABQ8TB88_PERAM|nr:hypothetical protein ANN_04802 [Periplaneta americana]